MRKIEFPSQIWLSQWRISKSLCENFLTYFGQSILPFKLIHKEFIHDTFITTAQNYRDKEQQMTIPAAG